MSKSIATIIAAALVLVGLQDPAAAAFGSGSVLIELRNGQQAALSLDEFDAKHQTFHFRDGWQVVELDVSDLARLSLDSTEAMFGETLPSADVLILNDGSTFRGLFRDIGLLSVTFLIVGENAGTYEIPRAQISAVVFGRDVLGDERRDFSLTLDLLGADVEFAMANHYEAQILETNPMLDDPAVNEYVNRLGQKIAAASKRPDLEYRFYVIDSPTVNAFTVGGGKVFLYRGLIEAMGNEAELAGVIAHEVGHVVGRHTVRRMTDAMRQRIFTAAGNYRALLREAKYSRDEERDADYLAVYNIFRLGYDPSALNSVFDTLRAVAGGDPSEFDAFFSEHPTSEERIENTTAEIERLNLKGLRRTSAEFGQMRARLSSLSPRGQRIDFGVRSAVVPAGEVTTYNVTVSPRQGLDYALCAKLVVSGAAANDIRVLVLDDENYAKWQNGDKATALHDSGRGRTISIEVPISNAGVYYFVLDNSFTTDADKKVECEFWAVQGQ
ncbi:MAG: M48 family metalloprotease [bacterium]|nr:M48 family metalloprotease [bacterium]